MISVIYQSRLRFVSVLEREAHKTHPHWQRFFLLPLRNERGDEGKCLQIFFH